MPKKTQKEESNYHTGNQDSRWPNSGMWERVMLISKQGELDRGIFSEKKAHNIYHLHYVKKMFLEKGGGKAMNSALFLRLGS